MKTLQKGKGLCLFRLTVFMSGYIYLPSGKMRNGNLVINAMQRNGHCETFVSNHK